MHLVYEVHREQLLSINVKVLATCSRVKNQLTDPQTNESFSDILNTSTDFPEVLTFLKNLREFQKLQSNQLEAT